MLSMVEYVHHRILTYPIGLTGVDMTMGNGNDTLLLAKHCKRVYAFDVQKEAIEATKQKVKDYDHVSLILDSHENFDDYVKEVDIAVFNLGYLPQFSHEITTVIDSTKIAIEKAVSMCTYAIFIVVYPGHKQGYEESLWIDEYVKSLDSHAYNVSLFKMLNKNNAPYVIEIERRKKKTRD